MSMMEAIACKLCGANGHAVELLETDGPGNGLYCPCCDRCDRGHKALEHTITPGEDEEPPPS